MIDLCYDISEVNCKMSFSILINVQQLTCLATWLIGVESAIICFCIIGITYYSDVTNDLQLMGLIFARVYIHCQGQITTVA